MTETTPCATCGTAVGPYEVFPNRKGAGILCMDCYAKTPEGQYVPTAEELARMWGGR